jgi:hypothetical protein
MAPERSLARLVQSRLLAALAFATGGLAGPAQATPPLPTAMPTVLPADADVPAWRLAQPWRVLAGQDLFELIDGGAEIYHEFGFDRVIAASYAGDDSASLQVEIYRMQSAEAAYGVFSMMVSPSGRPVALGDEARLYDEYLLMWSGRYFVSITALGATARHERVLTTFAASIARRIDEHAKPPALLAALPAPGLSEPRYFRGPVAFSNLYAFGGANVFGVREGVAGQYADHRLFLLQFPTPADAARNVRSAAEALTKDGGYRSFAHDPDGFACTDADGSRISVRAERERIVIRIAPPPPTG